MELNLSYDISLQQLTQWLREQGWVKADAMVQSVEKPGEGNMNMVLRVVTQNGNLILKQANPFVQKYPTIAAPTERVAVEAAFYQFVSAKRRIKAFLPDFIGFDPKNNILAVQDLGKNSDYTKIYQKGQTLTIEEAKKTTLFLDRLHGTNFPQQSVRSYPINMALRQLNHAHLFVSPFLEDNGFDLDTVQPGLQELSLTYKTDEKLKKSLAGLGKLYLQPGKSLLHGDYYPGSWLSTKHGFQVIDPEFSFFGPAEYDMGVLMAHFKMAQLPNDLVNIALDEYNAPRFFDPSLMSLFASVEILRRIIGLAQLPLDLTLQERADLLKEAAQVIRTGGY
jgi:5-methylthioribose kinase